MWTDLRFRASSFARSAITQRVQQCILIGIKVNVSLKAGAKKLRGKIQREIVQVRWRVRDMRVTEYADE